VATNVLAAGEFPACRTVSGAGDERYGGTPRLEVRVTAPRWVRITGFGKPLVMATRKQTEAAKRNVKKAQAAAKKKRTLANLPKSVHRDLGKQGARGRARGGQPGRSLDDRNRQQLYELAKKKNIPGRSKMGKADLIAALRKQADPRRG
jgi:Rho termination factor, N-terminal domain